MSVRQQVEDAKVLAQNGRHVGALTNLMLAVAASARKCFPKGVVSTGRCNTSMKNVRRCVKAERLARPLIELQGYFVQVRLRVA